MQIPIGRTLLLALFGLAPGALAFTPTLHDQYNNCESGTTSQEWEAANAGFDAFLADDLVVPASDFGWNATAVIVDGIYTGSGPVETVNVIFYRDASGLPGAEVAGCHYDGIAAFGESAGDLSVGLPTPCTLPVVGDANTKYWVAVQSQMDFDPRGQWYWADRSVQSNSPAAWMNPPGGWGNGCTDWGRRGADCGIDTDNPDQCFAVLGFYGLFSNSFEIGNTSLWSNAVLN